MATKAKATSDNPLGAYMKAAELKQFEAFEAENAAPANDAGQPAGDAPQPRGFFGGGLVMRLVQFAISLALEWAKRRDPAVDEGEARAAVEAEVGNVGQGQLWSWLLDGGFAKILEWVKLIVSSLKK